MKSLYFHPSFQLNGQSFSSIDVLLQYAKPFSFYQFLVDWFSSGAFLTVHTSGSTGKPKPIQLKKEYMENSAKATAEFFNLPQKTTALLCLSTDYIAGKMMLVRALTLGWHLDVVAPTSEVKIEKKYDFSAMVPLQLRNSLSEVYKIKKLIVGGGVVANDLIAEIQKIPTQIFATYGMTETITHIAVKKLNNYQKNLETYTVLPNVKIYIDQRSCLLIKAPKVTDEFIVTNDVVQLISDTQFKWLGRYDNVINSGGIKLHPEKIEEKLAEIVTGRFFVAGISDAVLGEKLVLLIEKSDRFLKPTETKILSKIASLTSLSKYEIPKEVYFVDAFIETNTKKIQRKKTLDLVFSE